MPVVTELLCPKCRLWEIREDDAYCGWCTHPVGRLQVQIDPGSYFRIGEISPLTNLLMHNPTCGTVKISNVRVVRGEWVKLDWTNHDPVKPGGMLEQPLEIETLDVQADFVQAEIFVANDLSTGARVFLYATRAPLRPRLEPTTLGVWKGDPDTSPTALRVAVDFTPLEVERVTVNRPDLISLATTQIGELVSRETPLALNLHIDRERLFQEARPGETVPVEFTIWHDDVDGPTSTKAKIEILHAFPPVLDIIPENIGGTIEGTKPLQFFRPGIAEFQIRIRNRLTIDPFSGKKNGILRIAAIDLDHPDTALKTQWAEQFTQPLDITGGNTAEACFRLDVENFKGNKGSIEVLVSTDCPDIIPKHRHRIDFTISDIKRFKGVLALDFGTSNACCSTLDTGTIDPRPVKIEAQATTSPTVLQYLNIEGGFATVRIGQEVKKAELSNSQATVSRLKQRLGSRNEVVYVWPVQTGKLELREVREAVVDYLREVRKAAETANHCYFRDFVVTHPAVCSLRQYRNLRYAVQKAFAGEEVEIHFLQEPVASLLPLIRGQAAMSDLRGEYHAAAFDFGGGTTDVTVARIHQQRNARKTEVTLELVSSWGRRWGGEYLTDFLALELLERCQKVHPDKVISVGEVEGHWDEDQRFNRVALRNWAEQWKIAASEKKSFLESLQLRAPGAGSTGFIEFPDLTPLLNDTNNGASFEQTYCNELDREIVEMIGRLKRDLAKHGNLHLDFLQLSGKSSVIPRVQELFQKEFREMGTEVRTLPANQLKECVVNGACLWTQMTGSVGKIHLTTPSSLQITTSRLGILDATMRCFEEVIPLGCPLDQPVDRHEYFWNPGDARIIIHENLSEADEHLDERELQVHSFVPEYVAALSGSQMLTLHLSVGSDYQPHLSASTMSGTEVQFRLEPS